MRLSFDFEKGAVSEPFPQIGPLVMDVSERWTCGWIVGNKRVAQLMGWFGPTLSSKVQISSCSVWLMMNEREDRKQKSHWPEWVDPANEK